MIPYSKTRQLLGITDPSKDLTPEDRTVRGTLVRGLTENDVRLLDTFEGDVSTRRSLIQRHKLTRRAMLLQEYVRNVVSVHPLAPFMSLSSSSADAAIVPTTPPPLTPEIMASLSATHPPIEANTYIWIQPVNELKPELWDFAEFVRETAWKWVGLGAKDNEYYTEVDYRREMDGHIIERKIVDVEGEDHEHEKKVTVDVEYNPWKDE